MKAFREELERRLAEPGHTLALGWNTWDVPLLPVVDTAESGLLNVRVWRF